MKRTVRYFVSYAHDDGRLPAKLLAELKKQLGACKDYQFECWQDQDILVGGDWHEEIREALKTCDFGLLLVSPAFLGSRYIGNHELPTFIDGGKPCIPVALCPIDFKIQDLKGLQTKQIFGFTPPRADKPRSFSDCTSANHKTAFAHNLFQKITYRLAAFDDSGTSKLHPVEQAGQVIAVHLHPDFRNELGELLEQWNSAQTKLIFSPIRPPRGFELLLLSDSPIETRAAQKMAGQVRKEARFEQGDGIFQFCEGRLFDKDCYQLFSWTTCYENNLLDSSTISLFMKRKLIKGTSTNRPLFAMMVQSMLYALATACELSNHEVTRTCIMDFNNEMPDILLGLDHGPRFCPHCERAARKHRNVHLLALAASAKKFVRRQKE